MRFDRDGRQAGSALITTMIVSSALLVVGAFAVMQARTDLLVQHHTRTAVEVFYVAEAGLEHALADLASDSRFERILAGRDGMEGTADDGSYPFHDGPPDFFPRPPFRYDVRVERVDEDTAEIVSRGIGLGPAARSVSASVLRSTEPHLPAAASAFGLDLEMLLSDEFSLLGSEPGAPGEDVPALAVGDDESREKLLSELPETAKARIVGPRGAPSVAGRRFVDLTELAARIARLPEARLLPDGAAGDLGSGVLASRASLLLSNASGSGLLLVQGNLVVDDQLDFSGLVLVMGDVSFGRSSTVHIDGGLLQGAPGDRMSLLGAGHIEYDPDAIRALDAEVPEILPRRALVAGWREQF
jgi:hypothetical protein